MFSSSKIIKLNSLFIQQTGKNEKRLFTRVLLFSLLSSPLHPAKKNTIVTAHINNTLVLVKDIGNQTLKNAQSQCSNYDTTTTGETWMCTVN